MDEKKETALDDAVDGALDAEAGKEDVAEAQEPEGEEVSVANDKASTADQDSEPAEPAEAVEAAEQAAQAESADPQASASEGVEGAKGVAPKSAKKEGLEPKAKRATGTGIGDLVAVGIFSIILGVLLALPSFLGVTGGDEQAKDTATGVAATVNGVVINEDEVTQYVMDFRKQQGIESDDAWGEWMVMYGYTPKALRSDTVDFFVNRELLKQAITQEGIEVSESEVDDYIAMITEQVGGESAFKEALEMEGLTLETYRENILFSLQQQALAQKVAPAGEVDDAQVLELVKMYFPDQVDEDATTLEGVDESTVEEMRNMLASANSQQAFDEWMKAYREKANVVVVDMPESLPYDIDLTPYQAQADGAETSDGADAASGDAETAEVESEASSEEAASAESQDK